MARPKKTVEKAETAGQTSLVETPATITKSIQPYLATVVISLDASAEDGQIVCIKPEPDNAVDPAALGVYAGETRIGYLANKASTVRPGTKSASKLHNSVTSDRVSEVYAYLSEGKMVPAGKAQLMTYKAELFFVPKKKKKAEAVITKYTVIGGTTLCPGRKALEDELVKAAQSGDDKHARKEVKVGFRDDSVNSTNIFVIIDGTACGLIKNEGTDMTIKDEETRNTKRTEFKRLFERVKAGPITGVVYAKEPGPFTLEVKSEPSGEAVADAINRTVARCVDQAKVLEAKVKFMESMNIPEPIIISVLDYHRRFSPELEAMVPVPKKLYLDNGDNTLLRSLVYRIHGKHLRLVGEKGCGKNTLINTVCWLLHRPLHMVQGNSDLDKTDLLGTRTINDGNMGYELDTFLKVLEAGGDIDLDEANAIKPDVEILIHSLADDTRAINVPGYGKVCMGDGACMWATMNEDYVGTSDMNDATIDRFVTLRLGAPESMVDVLKQSVPTATKSDIAACQRVHADVLKAVRDQTISGTCISVRGLVDALECAPELGLKAALMDTLASKPQDAEERRTLENIISNCFR